MSREQQYRIFLGAGWMICVWPVVLPLDVSDECLPPLETRCFGDCVCNMAGYPYRCLNLIH